MDTLTPELRSENMRRIRSVDTAPELQLRRWIHALGYRYRLHQKTLPGKPDLVFASRRKAIFIHGCFWHQHEGCVDGHTPQSRRAYWIPKLERNQARDAEHRRALKALGWKSLIVWECQLRREAQLLKRVERFLGTSAPTAVRLIAAPSRPKLRELYEPTSRA